MPLNVQGMLALGARGSGMTIREGRNAMANTSHLLVFRQLDLQVAVGRPRGSGETVQPSRSLAERRLTMS